MAINSIIVSIKINFFNIETSYEVPRGKNPKKAWLVPGELKGRT